MIRTEGAPLVWGRTHAGWWRALASAMVLVAAPPFTAYLWMSCQAYGCALSGPLVDVVGGHRSIIALISALFPRPTATGFAIFGAWCALQLLLDRAIPGATGYGNITPAGHRLAYRLNGLRAFVVTVLVLGLGVVTGLLPPTLVYDHWGDLLVAANVWGLAMAVFVYVKARRFPSHAADRHFSGNPVSDFFAGIELNPRLGSVDLKFFHIVRLGMLAWPFVNLSCAAAQYAQLGYVTNAMLIVNLLQLVYVIDLLGREDWYLRTIDIQHDRFGFYLAWGSVAWLPFIYPLQAFYLVRNEVELSPAAAAAVLALALAGYALFLSVNRQRDRFRRAPDGGRIWGRAATWIDAPYVTLDGAHRRSRLLTSGWWGRARHVNYVGDVMMAAAFSLACGFTHVLPYFYVVYLAGLLVHRAYRDDLRCREKYGPAWDEYCARVPYRMIPGIW